MTDAAPSANVEPMHEDLKLAIGLRIVGECTAMLADAFLQRHERTGFTLDDLADQLGNTRDDVIAFMGNPGADAEHGDMGLREIAVMAAALGRRLHLDFIDISDQQPPWLRDGDGI